MSEPMQVAEYNNEPDWMAISRTYLDLKETARDLHADIRQYNETLNQLDGFGTSIINGRERLHLLRERIAQLEGGEQ